MENPQDKAFEGTRVDLGEDLLETTTAISRAAKGGPAQGPGAPRAPDLDDLLESARILYNEGFIEDAKKTLRKIVIADPRQVEARHLLDDILETELKQMFGAARAPRKPRGALAAETFAEGLTTDELLERLDREMKLGMAGERLSLFSDPEALEKYAAQVERDSAGVSAHDRIDLGVAYLEMDLPEVSVHLFRAAFAEACRSGVDESNQGIVLAALSLLAYALIVSGRPFEAVAALQPMIQDAELPRESKVEAVYLMGRAYEAMRNAAAAEQWYLQANEIERGYRDVAERLRAQAGPGAR